MSAITWLNVQDFEASISTVPVNAQTAILTYVNAYFDVDQFDGEGGPELRLARIYLAAHHGLAAVPVVSGGTAGDVTGPIQSETGGDGVSVTYAALATASEDLTSTKWGRKLMSITTTSLARAWVVL